MTRSVVLYAVLLGLAVLLLPWWALVGAAVYAFILLKTWLWGRYGGSLRPFMGAMLPLLALDCIANAAVTKGSFRNTLSAQAWFHRDHGWWGWTHRFIDALFPFQPGHCRIQAQREAASGSVWASWSKDWASASHR